MSILPPLTAEHIRKAARLLAQLRPSYGVMLDFYGKVFGLQEQAKADIDPEPIRLSPATVAERRQNGRPLVDASDLAFDPVSAERLLEQLCGLAVDHPTEMKASAAAVSRAVACGDLDPQELFARLLNGDDPYFQDTAARIGSDPRTMAFLAYNSIQPSVEMRAAQLATYLDPESVRRKGDCPVCGSPPVLAVLVEEGQRVLSCRFCRHQWRAPRIFCVFCGNTKTAELAYFFAKEEDDLRTDVCERCRRYIKTVDRRKVSRPLFPPLEQVASLHLDMIAAEKGYQRGAEHVFDTSD